MNAAVYVRVSTQEQVKDGYSIGEQIERLKKYCDAMRWDIFRVYSDAGFSGASTDRPALNDMIADIKAGRVNIVVVYKLDRLSRAQLDTLYLIEKVFLANGCDFVSMNENFDTSTPFGRAMIGMLAVFAQLEREQIKERLTMGAEARAKEGKWRGGIIPYGYDYDKSTGLLSVNDYEAMIVREIFKQHVSGVPMHKIELWLRDRGFSQRRTPFTACNLRYILTNRLYAGQILFRGQWMPGIHDPIIDEATFAASDKIIESHKRRKKESNFNAGATNTSTYLGGLIYCARCGARYGKRREGVGAARHDTYCCYSRSKKLPSLVTDPNCNNRIYRIEELDGIIFGEIKKLAFDPAYMPSLMRGNGDDETKKIRLLETELKRTEEQISRFYDLYGNGRFSAVQLDSKLVPLENKRDALKAEIDAKKRQKNSITEAEAKRAINSFADILNNGDFTEIRSVIETLIDRIEIDGTHLTVHWRFA